MRKVLAHKELCSHMQVKILAYNVSGTVSNSGKRRGR